MRRYNRLINSVVAFVGALFLSIILHEFAHAITALLLGSSSTVYVGYEQHTPLSAPREVAIALAGPVFSLLSGVITLLVIRSGRGFGFLFATWFGGLSVQNFFGYLVTGPFVPYGDVGKALALLSAPGWVYGVLFIGGPLGTILLGRVLTARLLRLTDDDSPEREKQLRQLAFFTWAIGAAVVLLLSIGTGLFTHDGVFEALGVIAAGVPAGLARFYMRRLEVDGEGFEAGIPWIGIGVVVLLEILRLTLLASGVEL